MSRRLRRAAAWVAGAWAGVVGGIGFVAAPVVFATLPRVDAGRVAARLFAVDATIGVAAGALLLMATLRIARDVAEPRASRFSVETLLALGALFCIVAGHYAVRPWMEAAARGEPGPSFATLHIVGAVFFALKFLLLALLAWRLTGSPPAAEPRG